MMTTDLSSAAACLRFVFRLIIFSPVELLGHDFKWPYEHLQSVQPKDSHVEGLVVFY